MFDLGGDFLPCFFTGSRQDDLGPGFRECDGGSLADAGRATGDQSDFILVGMILHDDEA
jgi:hypothetical protein